MTCNTAIEMKIYRIAEDYKGSHSAPASMEGASLDDVSAIYPDDIYGPNGVRYYGGGYPYDGLAIQIIRMAKGKPNMRVKVYRAVPDINRKNKKLSKELWEVLAFKNHHRFFPMNNDHVYEAESIYQPIFDKGEITYDEFQQKVYEEIKRKAEEVDAKMSPQLKINAGDWVTITKPYAKDHGESWLQGEYRIVEKTVLAKQLHTTGDSLHEWGYNP